MTTTDEPGSAVEFREEESRVEAHSRDFVKDGVRLGMQSNPMGGTFLANFATSPSVNISSGDKVDIFCKMDTGDVVAQTLTVP